MTMRRCFTSLPLDAELHTDRAEVRAALATAMGHAGPSLDWASLLQLEAEPLA